MFSIGLPEIAIIFLALVIFIKPEDIPKVFHTLGRWYGNFRRLYIGVTDEFRDLSYQLDLKNRPSSSTKSQTDSTQTNHSNNDDSPHDNTDVTPTPFNATTNKR